MSAKGWKLIVLQTEDWTDDRSDARTMEHASETRGAASEKELRFAEGLVLAGLPLLLGAVGALLHLLSWQFDFRPTDHPSDYWLDAGNKIRSALRLGVAAAGSAGACCVGSLVLPHRLRTSGWAIILLGISGLLLGAVVLVGTGSAEMAHGIATSP
jgi:hypothetical protein